MSGACPTSPGSFLTTEPSYINDTIGILPNILNTIYLVVITLIIILPLGVGAAVYLTEYAKNQKLVAAIEFATETLTGIPSIIFGLVGMLFFCELLGLEASLLAGCLTLVIVTIPTIIRTTQESLKTVPQSYREASLGLGAGKWHMIRTVVLPSSIDGIVTGCILAIGRIVGECAALLFTAGMGMGINDFFGSWATSPRLRRQPHRGPVRVRPGAGGVRRGLRHRRHPDAADAAHQPGRQPGGPETERK